MKDRMELLKLQIIKLMIMLLFVLVAVACLIAAFLWVGEMAAMVGLMLCGVVAIVFAVDMLNGRQIARLERIHDSTIRGFVNVQASDDRGEILRDAVRLASMNNSAENRSLQLSRHIQQQAAQLAADATPTPAVPSSDPWSWMDMNMNFVEAE